MPVQERSTVMNKIQLEAKLQSAPELQAHVPRERGGPPVLRDRTFVQQGSSGRQITRRPSRGVVLVAKSPYFMPRSDETTQFSSSAKSDESMGFRTHSDSVSPVGGDRWIDEGLHGILEKHNGINETGLVMRNCKGVFQNISDCGTRQLVV